MDSQHSDDPTDSPEDANDWERYRPWLRLLARSHVDTQLRGKCDPSDIVQQTMIEVLRADASFRGTTEPERLSWLRKILAGVACREFRRYGQTQKRDLNRERSIEQSLAKTSVALGAILVDQGGTPSRIVAQREQEVIVAEAIEALPDDYRNVILLRNLESLSHEEVAGRMGRTTSAVRMLWLRALKQLRREVLSRQ